MAFIKLIKEKLKRNNKKVAGTTVIPTNDPLNLPPLYPS
jgi:hypothetical protein